MYVSSRFHFSSESLKDAVNVFREFWTGCQCRSLLYVLGNTRYVELIKISILAYIEQAVKRD